MPEFLAPEFLPWLAAFAALFGLIWGSFLNVCIFRVVRDLSVVTPRSFCPHCDAPIAWYDNLPLISYLLLRGRCRQCGNAIGLRYPLVEAATAILFGLVLWRYGWSLAALKWALFESLMIVLFCTDLDVQILPDEFTLGGVPLGLAFAFFVPVPAFIADMFLMQRGASMKSLVGAVLGAILIPLPLWAFAALYKRVRRLDMDPLGLGDVKLMALLGVFFGFDRAVPVFIWGTVAGAVAGGIYLALKGRMAWKAELPFGSFLCATGAIAALLIAPRP